MSLRIQVVPTYDSRAFDVRPFLNPKVYRGPIVNEKAPMTSPPCFLGAWYRKVFSSFDAWLGIEGVIELGEFTPDEARFNLDGQGRYMDVPSIYMGGKSHFESDAGLGLGPTYLSNDFSMELNQSSPKLAYRPFWRYIYQDASELNGNVKRREINSWNVTNPRSVIYNYFPGDVLRMSVYSPIIDYLQLHIELIKTTTIPQYMNIRAQYHLENNRPDDFFSPLFFSKGHGIDDAEFKRVNAIDQFGNEGFHAQATKAKVSKAVWHETYLYRLLDGEIRKVPFSKARQTRMICPNNEAITVEALNEAIGSEAITIHPGEVKGG
ncbi:MAG TPA: hypothetical protein PK087_00630 [Bacilli bacterium]|nr:MAG: hypothetical protein BWY97_01209 [Tenericutes bacterium ADurb.BinA124]HNZ50225.1 hypothetical protein [Bacilli bacterium]HOH17803.1 hypothetical protein [Bacilli bacterium]HPN60823.1 hypothetical protein [Bacilli bacterium]HPX83675.1 hypothetical protein [Bacilli bacterium]